MAAYKAAGSSWVYSNTFTGGQERELWDLGGLNSAYLQFNEDGSRLAADGFASGSAPPVRLLHADGSWRLDLVPQRQGYFTEYVSISSSGSRVIWLSDSGDPNSIQQIWVCNVNSGSIASYPVISNPSITPDYLLLDGSNTTVVAADMASGITSANVDALLDGEMQFRVLGFFTNPLLDNGLNNDAVAGDGRFTSANLRRDHVNATEANYHLRLAAFTDDHVTAIDVPGLRMTDGLPEDIADTDQDGLVDLLESAFGTNPAVPDAAEAAPVIVVSTNPSDPVLSITFRRLPDGTINANGEYTAGGFTYRIETSINLADWEAIDDQILSVITQPVGSVDQATVRLPATLLEHVGRYLRVVATRESQ